MAADTTASSGPDLTLGIALAELNAKGMLAGHVGDESVLLVRHGDEVSAVGALCQHYHAPLVEGLVVDNSVRCPWHHACFDLRTGEAVRAPAFAALTCWSTEQRDGKVFVQHVRAPPAPRPREEPRRIVIIGGGAAGFAAAEMLRRQGYAGALIVLSEDEAPPVDRPNLSKDYLAGQAGEDWLPLSPEEFYKDHAIELRLNARVAGIDIRSREVTVGRPGPGSGAHAAAERLPYDRLLLATGAQPVRLSIPGADLPHVFTLRSLADCRAIIARAASARRAVVMGASFIGLEVAASLRTRGIEVHVVAPERRPMERILGPQLGDLVRTLHEQHGVVFHLEDQAIAIDATHVRLKSGGTLEADLIVVGVGVRPRTELAETARLTIDRGIVVDQYLESSAPGVFAAGDIARWPDPHSGENIRVEHWVVAERHGQTAARNMLGAREAFTAVPFFWSQHYDVRINYVGHAEHWDDLAVEGDIGGRNCLVSFGRGGRTMAAASIARDLASLESELKLEERAVPTR
ncbi:MAG TPA: FAD-dependent oxidoreductase [Steroidobacteraceae bacterium]